MTNTPALEYFDLGSLESWNFMDWSTSSINVDALNAYLDSFSVQLKEQKLKNVMLSFAQVVDIPSIVVGNFDNLSDSDALGMLYKNVAKATIEGQSVLQYMIQRFVENGLTVGLSFGGANASNNDWDFGFSTNDPTLLANKLATWANSMRIAWIDFDVENTAFSNNNSTLLASFFQTLYNSVSLDLVSFTVMGDINYWGLYGTVFENLFKAAKFNEMFHGLNLMLYNGQYYLNAGQTPTQSWDLFSWTKEMADNTGLNQTESAALINVGYNSKIDYSLTSSSGGPLPYTKMPEGYLSGSAAAYILTKLDGSLQTLVKDKSLILGNPFFWDDNADYTVSETLGYQSQFFKNTGDFEKDFFELL